MINVLEIVGNQYSKQSFNLDHSIFLKRQWL